MRHSTLDLVHHAKQRGFQVSFNTNGYLLSEDKMDALIEMETDAMRPGEEQRHTLQLT